MKRALYVAAFASLAIVLDCMNGCSPAATMKNSVFMTSSVSSIRQGMTTTDVEVLFGKPDVAYEATYGEETGNPWDAIVWKYYVDQDPDFQFEKRYRTNTFVFFRGNNPPILNHWTLERVLERKQ